MKMNELARDVKVNIYNQLRYGNEPLLLICSPEMLEYLIDFHNGNIVDEEGNVWFMGLQVFARKKVQHFYVR